MAIPSINNKKSSQKIDIQLPYWGEFNLFKKTVESVLVQTETNWMLSIFDDAYPSDEAKKYIKSLGDKRITYFRHKKNIGITKNFNYAAQAAKSPYCVILGCDDVLYPTYVETALKNIGDADFYQPGVEIIDGQGAVSTPLADRIKRILRPKSAGLYQGEELAASLCAGNWLYFPSIVWKTDIIQQHGFDTNHDDTQDVILELKILKNGGTLFVDNEVTFQYRRFADSWSSRRKSKAGNRFKNEQDLYNDFADEFKRIGWNKAARAARLHITSRLHRILTSIRLDSI